jgi:hypothetical protein
MPAGMPIGCADESECQLECRAFFTTGMLPQWSARLPHGQGATLAANTHTHTQVHTLGVLAQRFVCESHAAVSNLASCYLTGHFATGRAVYGTGDAASGLLLCLPPTHVSS